MRSNHKNGRLGSSCRCCGRSMHACAPRSGAYTPSLCTCPCHRTPADAACGLGCKEMATCAALPNAMPNCLTACHTRMPPLATGLSPRCSSDSSAPATSSAPTSQAPRCAQPWPPVDASTLRALASRLHSLLMSHASAADTAERGGACAWPWPASLSGLAACWVCPSRPWLRWLSPCAW